MKTTAVTFFSAISITTLISAAILINSNSAAYQASPSTDPELIRMSSIKENKILTVVVNGFVDGQVYAGTDKFLYLSPDGGKEWKVFTQVKAKINCLKIDNKNVFVATDKGLFLSSDNSHWDLIYSSKTGEAGDVYSIVILDATLFIGTNNGLYNSPDYGKTWKRVSSIEDSLISTLAITPLDKGTIYVATDHGLFKYRNSDNFSEKVFDISNQEMDEITDSEDLEGNEYEELNNTSNRINSIAFGRDNQKIYLGSQKGIFYSNIDGKSWSRMSSQGLLGENIHKLDVNFDNMLFAATDKGLFRFDSKSQTWGQVYSGLNDEIWDVSFNKINNEIFIATSHGLFKADLNNLRNEKMALGSILKNFSNEPRISEVQDQAIKYAEVHPSKINTWRKLAAKKALLPKITADADRYVTDLIHWDSGQNPDAIMKGDDAVQWGVSVSWDLGELVWNPDQTSIDTRSRLMVQLRQDILDEVNRVYFERRRLQIALLKSPPESEAVRIEKELRIEELTADLDALTGGYFSQTIESKTLTRTRDIQSIE